MKYRYFLALFCASFATVAQQKTDSIPKTNSLDEVVISSLHINDSLMQAPVAISVLSPKMLQRGSATDVSAVMNRVPGVLMQSGSLNTNRISIRGIGARTPFGTNKIRAFYGSIPLTSGDSETTIEDLDLQNLSKAEIIKGPLSSVYGAGLGGAILLTPDMPMANNTVASVVSTFGSYGLSKFNASVQSAGENASINYSYHTIDADGWRQNSDYHREAHTLSGELFQSEKSKLTYIANYTYLKAFIPSSINKQTFDNNPRAAAPTWLASKGFEQYDSYLAGLDYDFAIGKIRNKSSVFLNAKNSNEPRPFDVLRQNTFGYGARTQFSGNVDGLFPTAFIVGAEFFNDNFKGRTYENRYEDNNGNGSLQGDKLSEAKQRRQFYNLFAQARMKLLKKLQFQAGLNVNQTRFTLDNVLPAAAEKEKYNYETVWSPQVSMLYIPNSQSTIYISVSRGFSLPSVEETLTAGGGINTNIKPEIGTNFEFGAKNYFFNRHLYSEVTLYHMEIKDLLVAKRIGDDQYVGINAGRSTHRGVEFLGKTQFELTGGWILENYISGSYGEYKFKNFDDNGNDFSGNKLPGVPQAKIGSGMTLTSGIGWYFSADFLHTGKMALNDANSATNDSYNLLDLETGWKIPLFPKCDARLAIGINNATNEDYASMILVNATSNGNAAPRYYYPGLPANGYGSFSMRYAF